jgi:hypothetical protein
VCDLLPVKVDGQSLVCGQEFGRTTKVSVTVTPSMARMRPTTSDAA